MLSSSISAGYRFGILCFVDLWISLSCVCFLWFHFFVCLLGFVACQAFFWVVIHVFLRGKRRKLTGSTLPTFSIGTQAIDYRNPMPVGVEKVQFFDLWPMGTIYFSLLLLYLYLYHLFQLKCILWAFEEDIIISYKKSISTPVHFPYIFLTKGKIGYHPLQLTIFSKVYNLGHFIVLYLSRN